jgi:dTDP-4-amino-4,6-dideoxygalactose transaminase
LTSVANRTAHTPLREQIKSEFSALDVLLTDSGTSALSLALSAARGREGLVALPAYACYDLATAADGADVRVVLYDVDPATLAPDSQSLARALEQRPSALVAVHLYGIPVDIDGLRRLCRETGTLVIEDAAQAVGASVQGKPAGTRGPFALLSFGRGKGISGGGGGALIVNDAAAGALLRQRSAQLETARAGWDELARAAAQWLLGRPTVYGTLSALPFLHLGETIYHAPRRPRSLSRASSRMVSSMWSAAQAEAHVRRAHAQRLLLTARGSTHWRTIDFAPAALPGYLRLPLITAQPTRDSLLTPRAASLGIMPGYPLPLHKLSGFRDRCVNASERFPGAQLLASQLITLPTHGLLTHDDVTRLEDWLRDPVGSS